jgi:predicted O-methyltransferase YrrM
MRPMFEAAKKLFGDKPVIGVEVGTSAGKNAVEILNEWKEITKLYCVDSYPTYADFREIAAQKTMLFCAINSFRNEPKANLIIESSVVASKKFPDGHFDFVYIDANHSYSYVKEDITAWLPKVKKGGIIGGHDLDWKDTEAEEEYAVLKAVEEMFPDKFHHNPTLFTRESPSSYNGYYSGLNSDWWVLL